MLLNIFNTAVNGNVVYKHEFFKNCMHIPDIVCSVNFIDDFLLSSYSGRLH